MQNLGCIEAVENMLKILKMLRQTFGFIVMFIQLVNSRWPKPKKGKGKGARQLHFRRAHRTRGLLHTGCFSYKRPCLLAHGTRPACIKTNTTATNCISHRPVRTVSTFNGERNPAEILVSSVKKAVLAVLVCLQEVYESPS